MTAADPSVAPVDDAQPRGRQWTTVLAIGALLATSLLPLGAVIQGMDWWLTAIGAIAAVLVPAGIVRSVGGRSWVGTLVGGGVWLLGLVIVYAPGSAILGVIPTPETISAFRDLAVEAGRSLYVQSVPVEPITALQFLLAVGLGAIAVLADVVGMSLRSPALTGVLAIGMLVPPSIFTGSIDLVAYAIVAVVFLVVLRFDGRRPAVAAGSSSARSAALMVGAAAVAVTVVAATLVPTFSTRSLIEPDGESAFGSGVSELADLGRDLQRPGNTPHLQYQTTSTSAQYLRLLTLDRFEGTQWTSSGEHATAAQADGERLTVPGLDGEIAREEATANVEITGLVGDLLPVPFPSVAVDGLSGQWQWDTEGLTLSSPTATVEDQEYSVTSLVIEPTADQLRNAPAEYPDDVTPFLDLPDEVPDTLQSVFDEVTAGTANGYDAAYAIQQFFRTEFRYSVSTPVQDGYDGDGFDAIADFLEERSGYCVHFASAMAILTRMAGIPSRVSLGYLPGDRVGSDDDGFVAYRVGSDDLHAWPELYFAGVGWVPFEPTPGRGVVPSYALQTSEAPDEDDVPDGSATRTPSATPTPSASTDPDASSAGSARDVSAAQTTAVGSVLLVLVLLLVLSPGAIRLMRRRRRWAAATIGSTVLPVWDDLVDSVADLGYPLGEADSERDLASRLEGILRDDVTAREALGRLLASTEAERYAGPGARTDEGMIVARRDDAVRVVGALGQVASRSRRARAAIAPASVLSPMLGARARPVQAHRDT
ncbi:transglutaminase-like putative cysteine protease [Labedella gwakjiensis]|uniref:Transglutaminase domain-containing protein n=1 Tax=Labedella gwakjiensis TaxID=390269 RepID=A0A2P8H0Q5_9MICO|nr:DUF3488 and transglutaminase-like domain-containing protein [Labedella gwakjiensis]PSL39797.1 transglutaminase-like putative cysteine protease [Labedella gwakjiensis]RUQ85824.1 transglutaminase domain-containing protein [Labedella gwakjiensis]